MLTGKPWLGYAAALRPIEIIRLRIFGSPLRWRGLARWTRRRSRRGWDLPSTRVFNIRRLRTKLPTNDPTYLATRERLYEGLRMAGVPEV